MATVHVSTALAVALHIISAAMAGTPPSTTERPKGEAAVARCSSEERACWARGELRASGACHAPLEQGPCADAQWLLLDARAMPRGTCALRPCPPAQLPSAGRCLEEAEAREMCWSGAVHLDALGRLRCGASPGWRAILKAHVRCQQPDTRPAHYNFTTDGGYYNATDDGYYNATDDGYYNGTHGGYYGTHGEYFNNTHDRNYNFTDDGYYNATDDGYYNDTHGGYYNGTHGRYYNFTDDGYYNATDDGYYNSTYYSGYNFTDDDFNSTNDYDTAPDYLTNSNISEFNSTNYPPLASKAMYVKAVVTAGEQHAIRADASVGARGMMIASAHAHIPLSVRALAAGALCMLLATRVTLC